MNDFTHGSDRRLQTWIVTGVDVFQVNEKESLLVLRHLERQKNSWACLWRKLLWTEGMTLVLFMGGLELLGITGYIPAIRFSNDPSKCTFS